MAQAKPDNIVWASAQCDEVLEQVNLHYEEIKSIITRVYRVEITCSPHMRRLLFRAVQDMNEAQIRLNRIKREVLDNGSNLTIINRQRVKLQTVMTKLNLPSLIPVLDELEDDRDPTRHMENTVIAAEHKNKEKVTCSVCMDELKIGANVKTCPQCHQNYHIACICKWLSEHDNCPYCRHKLRTHTDFMDENQFD